ncbi:MAG: hypothetical protein HC764_21705 [Pleurocapsa sp. CRU_1_2]|nr:hypothetical protein [Pleurocapsa sp. CRU_1_2]
MKFPVQQYSNVGKLRLKRLAISFTKYGLEEVNMAIANLKLKFMEIISKRVGYGRVSRPCRTT